MKFLTTILLLLVGITTYSQQDSVPSRQGQLYLGLNTNLINQSPIYASVDPTVTYFLSNNFTIGGKLDYSKEREADSETNFVVYSQYYFTDNMFVLGSYSTDTKGMNKYGAAVGYTAFLGSRFYLEPSWGLEIQDNNYHGRLNVSCGIRLK